MFIEQSVFLGQAEVMMHDDVKDNGIRPSGCSGPLNEDGKSCCQAKRRYGDV